MLFYAFFYALVLSCPSKLCVARRLLLPSRARSRRHFRMHAVHACRRFIDDVSCVRAALAEPSLIDECSVSAQHFNSAPSRNHVCPFRPGGCERFRLHWLHEKSTNVKRMWNRSTSPFGPADAGPGQGTQATPTKTQNDPKNRKKATCPEAIQSKRVPHAAALVLGAGVGGLWAKPAWYLGQHFEHFIGLELNFLTRILLGARKKWTGRMCAKRLWKSWMMTSTRSSEWVSNSSYETRVQRRNRFHAAGLVVRRCHARTFAAAPSVALGGDFLLSDQDRWVKSSEKDV